VAGIPLGDFDGGDGLDGGLDGPRDGPEWRGVDGRADGPDGPCGPPDGLSDGAPGIPGIFGADSIEDGLPFSPGTAAPGTSRPGIGACG
jgi:hypothetical protein